MKTLFLPIVVCFLALTTIARAESVSIVSPDGKQAITVETTGGELVYRTSFKDHATLLPSRLGFLLEDGKPFFGEPNISGKRSSSVDRTWKPLYGERNEIPERYNETVLTIDGVEDRSTNLIVRAYDEGVAFCYEFPKAAPDGKPWIFSRELTEFVLAGDHPVWAVYSAQGVYEKVPVSKVKPGCQRPLLVEAGDDLRLSIGEARLVDFARMLFEPAPGKTNALRARLDGKVAVSPSGGEPYRTPWRFIAAAENAGTLLEQNYLLQNLNDPCAIADTSWIKPGKVIRETSLTTKGGKACVDFAVERGLQYIEFDAGWYGHEYDDASDATAVNLDPKRSKGPLDLQEVIKYADSKGIGVLVYVNQRALSKQLDDILPLYRSWGIKGIKFGFVHVGSQQWTTWLHDAVKKCADHKIMVDIHDEHRDTGWCRTYPNLMTVEGIRGNEEMPTPEHNVILSLTRMLCGIADYTPCWYTNRIKTSQAHQLALPVVFYGPWTFLYWYDNPGMFKGEPELDLWKELPTVWDDTKVLVDRLPDTIAIARRSGDVWYVGVLNANQARPLEITIERLGLKNDGRYRVTRYLDQGIEGRAMTVQAEDFSARDGKIAIPAMRANGGAVLKISIAN